MEGSLHSASWSVSFPCWHAWSNTHLLSAPLHWPCPLKRQSRFSLPPSPFSYFISLPCGDKALALFSDIPALFSDIPPREDWVPYNIQLFWLFGLIGILMLIYWEGRFVCCRRGLGCDGNALTHLCAVHSGNTRVFVFNKIKMYIPSSVLLVLSQKNIYVK